jgi:enoyl-CoA hydratase/carnithine racemase
MRHALRGARVAIFAQFEPAFGTVPGAGAAQHLTRLMGRGRAFAHRIAGFPSAAHATIKDRVNAIALAPADEFRRDSDLFGSAVREPEAQARIQAAFQCGLQTRDAELDFSRVLG